MIQRRTGPAGGHWLLFLLLLVVVLPGCKHEYERRLDLLVDELRKGSDFNVLTQKIPINLPSVSVTLLLPPDLVEVDAKADPRRLKLTIAAPLDENNLSDMRTFEGTVADSVKGEQHYYLYVGSVNLAEGGIDDMMVFFNHVRNVIRSLPAMEDVQVATRDGSMVTCRKCRATAQQVFFYKKPDGSDDYPQMEGLLEIWDRKIEPAKKHLVMVWRVPTVQGKDFIELDKKARLVAGGITVSAK
jgi:uncharacterized protein Usg